MTNDEAINTLKNTAWLGSEEQAEKVSEAVRMAVEALKRETSGDAIDRQAAIRIASGYCHPANVAKELAKLPSVQPEPISDVCMKAVWTWLLDYQIKAAELKGRYTPYEVLSWVANDWRKEHEGSD